jgi:hypothetical protein
MVGTKKQLSACALIDAQRRTKAFTRIIQQSESIGAREAARAFSPFYKANIKLGQFSLYYLLRHCFYCQ